MAHFSDTGVANATLSSLGLCAFRQFVSRVCKMTKVLGHDLPPKLIAR
jgi:hypothetical protein